jgi:hypothetical protein
VAFPRNVVSPGNDVLIGPGVGLVIGLGVGVIVGVVVGVAVGVGVAVVPDAPRELGAASAPPLPRVARQTGIAIAAAISPASRTGNWTFARAAWRAVRLDIGSS